MRYRVPTTEEFWELLKSGKMILFGTGHTAEVVCRALGEDVRYLRCCMVSGHISDTSFFEKPVIGLDDADPESLSDSVIAVTGHESIRDGIIDAVRSRTDADILWLYPVIHELAFGETVFAEAMIPVKEIVLSQKRDERWLELRYAAVKAAAEGRESDLYLRGMMLFSAKGTAKSRAARVPLLLDSMKRNGFLREYPILIDEDMRLIDGLHRLSCAVLLGIREVPARIVKSSGIYEAIIRDNVRATESELTAHGITSEELQHLNDLRDEMESKVIEGGPSVSVIVPAFNVGGFIDRCFDSLMTQTFSDFEVILINDGSTDDTPERCRDISSRYPNVRYISRENRGVSASRNEGVAKASGMYCAFVDPDDWLEPGYLGELYAAATRNGADFAECDLFRDNLRTGGSAVRTTYGKMGVAYTLEEHMKYAATAPYKSMFRRDLWTKNGISMPDCAFESPAVYSLELALANKTVNVRKPLYHYVTGREGSLIETGYAKKDGSANNTLGTEAMEYLVSEFRRTGAYSRFADALEGIVNYRLSDILATQFHRKSTDDYRETAENLRKCSGKLFPEAFNPVYINWGGYDLNRMLVYTDTLHDPYCRFNFMSMASLLPGGDRQPEVRHRNNYRRMMLEREQGRDLFRILREKRPEYLFFDLIEERSDLVFLGGRYITFNETADKAEISIDGETVNFRDYLLSQVKSGNAELIRRWSSKCREIWEEGFRLFAETAADTVPGIKIVAVENYLSEKYGDLDSTEQFPGIGRIREINSVLKGYYEYAREHCPGIIFVRAAELGPYMTDINYEHGCIPSHLNDIVDRRIGAELRRVIDDQRKGGKTGERQR